MFAFAHSFRATLLCAALASALVLADSSHEHKRVDHGRRHHGLNATVVERDSHIQKRFDNARFTYYDAGVNACGGYDQDSDFIVALNQHQWDGGSHCYEEITIEYEGKTANAKITDMCELCPYAAIDFSPGLFTYLVPGGFDQGVAYGTWNFGAGDPEPTTTKEKPTTTSKPPPSTTSTKHTSTTKHSTTTSSSTSTSTTHSSTSTTSTSSSSTSSSTSTSSAPTATVTSWDTGNLNQFSLALISLVELSQAGLANTDQA